MDETYDRSILSDDYEFYMKLKGNITFLLLKMKLNYKQKFGVRIIMYSIIWQVMLSNSIISIYGSGMKIFILDVKILFTEI